MFGDTRVGFVGPGFVPELEVVAAGLCRSGPGPTRGLLLASGLLPTGVLLGWGLLLTGVLLGWGPLLTGVLPGWGPLLTGGLPGAGLAVTWVAAWPEGRPFNPRPVGC